MAHEAQPKPDTPSDLAQEAAEIAAATGSLRNRTRDLHRRAAALRDKLEKAGIGFETSNPTTAREGEGDRQ